MTSKREWSTLTVCLNIYSCCVADGAKEFMLTFSKAYLKSFGGAFLDSILDDLENPKKLKYRDVSSFF